MCRVMCLPCEFHITYCLGCSINFNVWKNENNLKNGTISIGFSAPLVLGTLAPLGLGPLIMIFNITCKPKIPKRERKRERDWPESESWKQSGGNSLRPLHPDVSSLKQGNEMGEVMAGRCHSSGPALPSSYHQQQPVAGGAHTDENCGGAETTGYPAKHAQGINDV